MHNLTHHDEVICRLVFVLLPLNLIHPAPGLSFPIIIEQLGIRPKYRVESLIVGAMLPRVYHVFVLYKLKLLTSVLSLDSSLIVRNESAIRQLNDPGLSQPQLAFKIALERQPIRIIAMCQSTYPEHWRDTYPAPFWPLIFSEPIHVH